MESKLDGQTHAVNIVHTCGSCKISISGLKNIAVIDNFDLHIFNLKLILRFLADFYLLNSPRSLVTVLYASGWTIMK